MKRRDHTRRRSVDRRVLSEWPYKHRLRECELKFSGSVLGSSEGCCEYGNESLCFTTRTSSTTP